MNLVCVRRPSQTTVTFGPVNLSLSDAISFEGLPGGVDRVWLRLHAEAEEHVYGGGEQFSYFDLRGRIFPMWIQEQVRGSAPAGVNARPDAWGRHARLPRRGGAALLCTLMGHARS